MARARRLASATQRRANRSMTGHDRILRASRVSPQQHPAVGAGQFNPARRQARTRRHGLMTISPRVTAFEGELAIRGGRPVRDTYLPYGHQTIGEDDLAAVAAVLKSDWLTTGPKVAEFEQAFARAVGAREAVAVNSGTAALHAAMHALKIGPGDEVIVPSITFAATANAVLYCGATPVFGDVERTTLCISPASVADRITQRTRAVIAVDYAGQPCDYDALRSVTSGGEIRIVSDACHALGAKY